MEAPEEAVPITINGRHWDPSITYADDAERTNYITITTLVSLTQDQQQELLNRGAEIQEYVAAATYLCRYEPEDLQPIRDLAFVRQADVFRSKFKIVEDLKKTVVAAANGTLMPVAGLSSSALSESTDLCTVDIVLHQGLEASQFVLELSDEAHIDPRSIEYSSRKLRMITDRSRLKSLATHDCVRAMEEVLPKTTCNNYAREIMEADIIINNTAFHGEDQIITVSDTGFDLGHKEYKDGKQNAEHLIPFLGLSKENVSSSRFDELPLVRGTLIEISRSFPGSTRCHPAFQGRILGLKALIRQPKDGDARSYECANDPDGHGTHVCGSVVGQNMTSKTYSESSTGGVAPKARLIVQSMYYVDPKTLAREQIRTPLDLTDGLFDPPYYNHNSRVFSNSWGNQWDKIIGQRAYTINDAEEVDEFVWRTKDAVVLFSAGNDNKIPTVQGKPAIGASAAAKNCITVGATGSKRIIKKRGEDVEGMSNMSSLGPTREGRIKPDVVAPGVNILSTSTQDPGYQKIMKQAGDPYDNLFEARNGTSMATPLTAGCAAIVREVQSKHGHSSPSAALVKALIINGAVHLSGVPVDAQGFGRVHLKNSVSMITSSRQPSVDLTSSSPSSPLPPSGCCEGRPLKMEEKEEFAIDVSSTAFDRGYKWKITLVYSDPPGPMLQNNLNLIVRTGKEDMHGNGFKGDQYDEVNNVEQVVLEEERLPKDGIIRVEVRARKITAMNGEQPFGLAWRLL